MAPTYGSHRIDWTYLCLPAWSIEPISTKTRRYHRTASQRDAFCYATDERDGWRRRGRDGWPALISFPSLHNKLQGSVISSIAYRRIIYVARGGNKSVEYCCCPSLFVGNCISNPNQEALSLDYELAGQWMFIASSQLLARAIKLLSHVSARVLYTFLLNHEWNQ